uniref:SAM-dependent methyltransferase n=1 Tax=Streptomyces xiaopingdaonensis TaxID=1565415 RepID=UPI0003804C6D
YYLGGKDWFEADRQTAEAALHHFPALRTVARSNRAFMHRATRTLAGERGVRQFLDLGSGIPTEPNLHQVAQAEDPEARVVYVDNDPIVIEYTDALMRSTEEGRTAYMEADLRTDDVTRDPRLREVLDFDAPVALSLVALVHFFPDDLRPYDLVRRLLEPLPSGSFLVLSHVTYEIGTEEETREAEEEARRGETLYRNSGTDVRTRSRAEIARFFDGLELLDPGLVIAHRWRPDAPVELTDAEVGLYAGVARKP